MLKKSELCDVIRKVGAYIFKLSNFIENNEIIQYSEEIYNFIMNMHNEILTDHNEIESELNDILSSMSLTKYPELFIMLLNFEFPVNLLSSFTRDYCLTESDGILIMIEYLKFLTVWKLYGDGFSPSSWVDEFWHHHMSFNTRHYREFWLITFGKTIEHNEIDATNLTNSDQSYFMMKDNAFREHYFEWFDHEPIECIWPEITSECIEEPDIFVRLNLTKTLITKKTVWDVNQLIERNRDLGRLAWTGVGKAETEIIDGLINSTVRGANKIPEEDTKIQVICI